MRKLTQDEFIKRAIETHGKKYDYSKSEYIDSRTKVCIICPKHGEFMQGPRDHLKGGGCRKCCIEDRIKNGNWAKNPLTTEEFVSRARKIHGDIYDYTKTEYVNKRKSVIITCKEHGDFIQNPYNHITQKQGCPVCGKIRAQRREGEYKNSRKTTEQFKEELKTIFGGNYELIGEYVNNKTKVEFFCHNKNSKGEEHGTFFAKPNDIICGHGCKRCAHSLIEEKLESFLNEKNIKYERQKMFKDWLGKQKLDFYLTDYNIAIECQGRQHYMPVDFAGKGEDWAKQQFDRIKKLDENKLTSCKKHGIKMLYFTEESEYESENTFIDMNKLFNKIKEYGTM